MKSSQCRPAVTSRPGPGGPVVRVRPLASAGANSLSAMIRMLSAPRTDKPDGLTSLRAPSDGRHGARKQESDHTIVHSTDTHSLQH
jgi:hypothetical protein